MSSFPALKYKFYSLLKKAGTIGYKLEVSCPDAHQGNFQIFLPYKGLCKQQEGIYQITYKKDKKKNGGKRKT